MPVTRTGILDTIATNTTRIFWEESLQIKIRDILSNPNVFFTETSVQVLERLTINCIIEDFNVVDVDFNWAIPHYYIGNWQIANSEGNYSGVAENEGYITTTTTIIEKYSSITMCADPGLLSTVEGNIKLEQCNFQLSPLLKPIPPLPTPVLTYQLVQPDPAFEGFLQRIPPKLQETLFQPKISEVQVKTRPGCKLSSANYSIAPVNNIFIAEPQYQLPKCNLPDGNVCDQEFQNFVAGANGGAPIDSPNNNIYSTLENCVNLSGVSFCNQNTFTCSDGNTRLYWGPTLT